MTIACQTVTITAKGYLTINSTPVGARIWLAQHLGTLSDQGVDTNNTLTLAVGSYDARLVLAGYLNWEDTTGTITVTEEATTTVNTTFSGSVNMTSSPVGARIWLAVSPGVPVDLGPGMDTPLILTGMTAATSGATTDYNYKLTLAGYTDATGSFTATAGTTVNVPVTMATPANITATNIDVTTSETPCMTGTCTVTVVVRWTNSGGTDGTVIPNIKIDDVSQAPHASRTVPKDGGFIDETFIVVGLSAAAHAICPYPN